MGNKNELLQKIDEGYSKFSKGQKKLADFIKEDYDKAAFLTAAKMGEEVGVSESTVVRFAMALGYDGYPGFQKALGEMVRTKFHPENGSHIWTHQSGRDTDICITVRY